MVETEIPKAKKITSKKLDKLIKETEGKKFLENTLSQYEKEAGIVRTPKEKYFRRTIEGLVFYYLKLNPDLNQVGRVLRGPGAEAIATLREAKLMSGGRLAFNLHEENIEPYFEKTNGGEIFGLINGNSELTVKTILAGLKPSKKGVKLSRKWVDKEIDMLEDSGLVATSIVGKVKKVYPVENSEKIKRQ